MDGQQVGNREADTAFVDVAEMRRRRIRVLVISVVLSFLLLYAVENYFDSSASDSTSDPAGDNSGSLQPDSSKLAHQLSMARRIKVAAGPALYPSTLQISERFIGDWSLSGGGVSHTEAASVRPHPAPNISVNYYSLGGWSGPSFFPFSDVRQVAHPATGEGEGEGAGGGLTEAASNAPTDDPAPPSPPHTSTLEIKGSGSLLINLVSFIRVPSLPGIQAVDGFAKFYPVNLQPGEAVSPGLLSIEQRLSGAYLADEGLLLLVSSSQQSVIHLEDDSEAALAAAGRKARRISAVPWGLRTDSSPPATEKSDGSGLGVDDAAAAAAAATAAASNEMDVLAAATDSVTENFSSLDDISLVSDAALDDISLVSDAAPSLERKGGRGGLPRDLQQGMPMCDIIFALRLRPVGFDWSIPEPGEGMMRRRAEAIPSFAEIDRGNVGAALSLAHPGRSLWSSAGSTASTLLRIFSGGFSDAAPTSSSSFSASSLGSSTTPPASSPSSLQHEVGKGGGEGGGGRRLATDSGTSHPGFRFIPLAGLAISENCNFTMNVSTSAVMFDATVYEERAGTYALIATLGGLALGASSLQLLLKVGGSESNAARLSSTSLGAQSLLDAFGMLVHVMVGLTNANILSSFALASATYLITFAVLEMRLLLVAWKAQNPAAFAGGWEASRRAISGLYCRFYFLLIAVTILGYLGGLTADYILTFVLFSYWVPQIILCAQNDARPVHPRSHVLVVSFVRLLLPLYVLMCPYNILTLITPVETRAHASHWSTSAHWLGETNAWTPPSASGAATWREWSTLPAYADPNSSPSQDPSEASSSDAAYWRGFYFGTALLLWTLVQVVVLYLQGLPKYGPRFFVPAAFLPPRYDYHRKIDIVDGRIEPDAEATAPFIRTRVTAPTAAPAAAAATAAEDDGGVGAAAVEEGEGARTAVPPRPAVPPTQNIISRIRASVARSVTATRLRIVASARGHYMNLHWFWRGTRLTLSSWAQSVRSTLSRQGSGGGGQAAGGGGGGAAYSRVASDATDTRQGGVAADDTNESGEHALSVAARPPPTSTLERARELAEVVRCVGEPTSIDCVVCMDAISFPTARSNYMITPCDHIFHVPCLRPWMEQKLECPTCRMGLPEPGVEPSAATVIASAASATAAGAAASNEQDGDEAAVGTAISNEGNVGETP